MSMFNWFSRKKPAKPPMPESSGLSRAEATRPVNGLRGGVGKSAAAGGSEHAANRKTERMARRELLYSVVRESMVRAGMLSQSYKFKVLSLDQRGRQFLIMMDLASEYGGETHRLAEIEAMIAQSAKARYDILVTAVYWRMNEHVAIGRPAVLPAAASSAMAQQAAHPAPAGASGVATPAQAPSRAAPPQVAQPVIQPVAVARTAATAAPGGSGSRYEPIQADEVAAFKRALAAGATAAAAVAQSREARAADERHHGPRSYTLLTGYEDTEMPDPDVRSPALSATQYGDLN